MEEKRECVVCFAGAADVEGWTVLRPCGACLCVQTVSAHWPQAMPHVPLRHLGVLECLSFQLVPSTLVLFQKLRDRPIRILFLLLVGL